MLASINTFILDLQRNNIFNFLNHLGGIWLLILGILIPFIIYIFRATLLEIAQKIRNYFKTKSLRKVNARISLPIETIRVVPIPGQSYWSYGTEKVDGKTKEIIIAAVEVYVTNITRGGILVASTYMKKPKSEVTLPLICEPAPRKRYWGNYPIPSRELSELHASYVLDKKNCKKGNNLITSIVFVDQLGNEHLIKNVLFKYRGN